MNGIGIQDWVSSNALSSYPFESSFGINGLFADASFVQYDNFIPSLETLKVNADGIFFTFLLDDGLFTYRPLLGDCHDGTVFILRRNDRYLGTVVLGPASDTVERNYAGQTITIKAKFLSTTVRSLPSSAGLFSLQGLKGDVEVATDESQQLEPMGNSLTWNAVSMPSKVQSVQLSPEKLYATTTAKKLVEIDLANKSYQVVLSLVDTFRMQIINGRVLGFNGPDLVDLSTLPFTPLYTFGTNIKGITGNGSTTVVVTTDSLCEMTPALDGIAVSSPLSIPVGELSYNLALNNFLISSPGPYDYDASAKVSDLLYTCILDNGVTSEPAGLLSVSSNFHQPTIYGIAGVGATNYALVSDTTVNKLLKMNLANYTGTNFSSWLLDPEVGQFTSLFAGTGSPTIFLQKLEPLKTINAAAPTLNAMQLSGEGLIKIEQTGTDTLTVNLAADIENLKVSRSNIYEE